MIRGEGSFKKILLNPLETKSSVKCHKNDYALGFCGNGKLL